MQVGEESSLQKNSRQGWSSNPERRRLDIKVLPSVRRLGKGLSGFLYETTWKGNKYVRKDFPLGSVHHDVFEREAIALLDLQHRNIVSCPHYTVGRSSCSLLLEYVDDDLQNIIQKKIEAQRKGNRTVSSTTLHSRALDIDETRSLMSSAAKRREITGADAGLMKMPVNELTAPFEVPKAVDIISEIATGIEYLHGNGIVHGDLKPQNVLVGNNGIVKLVDFGLVETKKRIKLVSKRTRHFEILMWKAPELFEKLLGPVTEDSDDPFTDSDEETESSVIFSKSRLTVADVYSFGLVCSQILSGKLMHSNLSLTQLREQRMHGFRPQLPSTCPTDLRFLIVSTMERDPLCRPTFTDICTALKAFQSNKRPRLMEGVRRLGTENESANPSDTVGMNSSDRMSSGGRSGSAQNNIEESDVRSSLTSVGGGLPSALGNEIVRQESGPSPRGGSTKAVALEESPEALATMGPAESCVTADMSFTATDSVTIGHVDNQHLETTPFGTYPQQAWQRSVNNKESFSESSAVATGNLAGGSSALPNCFASNECPSHGMVSACGRRLEMEDAVVSKDSFVMLPCSNVGGCDAAGLESAPLHYFGVYDGHGGSQAANFCAERLHYALAEEVESCFVQGQNVDQTTGDWESKWLTAMTQCFKRMDAEVGGFCLKEGECPASDNPRCCPEPIAPETVGTTAIVAVVGACQIIVGNCGDSRAVLSRGGVAIPLSVDHKPEREDEMARVEAAGGRVIYWNGYRVLGVLAMSRAIGDRYLKPYVIAEPEVKCIKRAEDDECLILASDGLWSVMSNEVVCDIARKALNCRRNGQPPPAEAPTGTDDDSPAAQAAALLVKLALAKGSSDNISVVVVDLKAPRHR